MTELLYTPQGETELVRLVPGFILRDRNGYALARAVMHMVHAFLIAVSEAVVQLTQVEQMGEDTLDEQAYSLGMPWYDYRADVEKKRMWIREAEQMRRSIGTVAAITLLMNGVYASSKVEEWTQYGGEPYHFRVTVFGKFDADIERWAREAIENAKNLRSVLDGFLYSDVEGSLVLSGGGTPYDVVSRRAGEEPGALPGA